MLKTFNREKLRPFALALMIIGVLALVLAAYRYVDAWTQLQNNQAYQVEVNAQTVTPENEAMAQTLIAAGMEYRRLNLQRNEALMIGGGGLVLLALGWLGSDLISGKKRKAESNSAPA
ncbi:MAG: hypothetical protein JNJ61_21560 [Anaerolineae bacterium]|nr:hypothetical protein [Anaerolineae bacterium]